MSRANLYFWIFVLGPVFLFWLKPFDVGDLSIWTALGRDMIIQKQIITRDAYSFSPTAPMIYPVGFSLIYGGLYLIGHLALVAYAHALALVSITLIWLSYFKRKYQPEMTGLTNLSLWGPTLIFILLTAIIGTTLVYIPRPALVATIPLLLSYIILSERRGLTTSDIAKLVLIEILWVNIHGSFALLPVMLGWSLAASFVIRDWKLAENRLIALLFVGIAALVNPFGYKIIPYTLKTATLSQSRHLEEWSSSFQFSNSFASTYFFAVSALLFILIVVRVRRKKVSLAQLISDPIAPLWIAGFVTLRHTFILFLLLPVFATRFLDFPQLKLETERRPFAKAINAFIVILFAVATLSLLSPFRNSTLPTELQPTFSLKTHLPLIDDYLQTHQGRVFNEYEYGSDLALQQPNKYFIDSRNIIFDDETDALHDDFMKSPAIKLSEIRARGCKFILASTKNRKALAWLETSPEVSRLVSEGPATLFEIADVKRE